MAIERDRATTAQSADPHVDDSHPHQPHSPAGDAGTEGEMEKYGITRRSVDYFDYRDFRYTSLTDAVAQARRDHPRDD